MSTQPASEMERLRIAQRVRVIFRGGSCVPFEHVEIHEQIMWLEVADFILARDAERSRIAVPQVEADRLHSFIHEG